MSRYPIKKIELKQEGVSTLGARKIWYDPAVNRLNDEERGDFVGSFKGEDQIVEIAQNGQYRLISFDLSNRLEEGVLLLNKRSEEDVYSLVYLDNKKNRHYLKRFRAEAIKKAEALVPEEAEMQLVAVTHKPVEVELVFRKERGKDARPNERILSDDSFISVKGIKAKGKQMSTYPVKEVILHELAQDLAASDEASAEAEVSADPSDGDAQISMEL